MQTQRLAIAAAAATAIALGLIPGAAPAQVRVDPQPLPYYARIVTGTGEWTPVIFYRPADCIPESFNLLSFFDPPRFACGPMTVDGFAIWETGPGLDPAPMQARLRGLGAVPIWFVRTEDYLAAGEDGVLTIGELEALDPLMGQARLFSQVQHPFPPVENSLLVINATGDAAGRTPVQAPCHAPSDEGPPARPGELRGLTVGRETGLPGPRTIRADGPVTARLPASPSNSRGSRYQAHCVYYAEGKASRRPEAERPQRSQRDRAARGRFRPLPPCA